MANQKLRKLLPALRREFLEGFDKEGTSIIELPACTGKDLSPASVYKYYWVSENMQYYDAKLVPFKVHFRRHMYYWLESGLDYAVFDLGYDFDDYMKLAIRSAERAAIRKSIKAGMVCRPISYDDHLPEIREINTSKDTRGGRPMTQDYVEVTKRDAVVLPVNPHVWTFGCFEPGGRLVAYYTFELITNFFHTVKGIGHRDWLRYGVMNHLFGFGVCELAKLGLAERIVYGVLSDDPRDGLSSFKRNVGCVGRRLLVSGTREQFEVLEAFSKKYALHGDTSKNFITDYILR